MVSFRDQGLGFGVWGLGTGAVWVLILVGLRISDLGFRYRGCLG